MKVRLGFMMDDRIETVEKEAVRQLSVSLGCKMISLIYHVSLKGRSPAIRNLGSRWVNSGSEIDLVIGNRPPKEHLCLFSHQDYAHHVSVCAPRCHF